jgi:hypothetical protein
MEITDFSSNFLVSKIFVKCFEIAEIFTPKSSAFQLVVFLSIFSYYPG